MITKDNALVHELIGLSVRVVKSADKDAVGLSGRVVDETKNTFLVEARGEVKTVPKQQNVFEFTLPSGEKAVLEGKLIAFAPEERPKKLWKHVKNV